MNLRVMRPADGKMMKLVKYNLTGGEDAAAESATADDMIHNHKLKGDNTADLTLAQG